MSKVRQFDSIFCRFRNPPTSAQQKFVKSPKSFFSASFTTYFFRCRLKPSNQRPTEIREIAKIILQCFKYPIFKLSPETIQPAPNRNSRKKKIKQNSTFSIFFPALIFLSSSETIHRAPVRKSLKTFFSLFACNFVLRSIFCQLPETVQRAAVRKCRRHGRLFLQILVHRFHFHSLSFSPFLRCLARNQLTGAKTLSSIAGR